MIIKSISFLFILLSANAVFAQKEELNLTKLYKANKLIAVNRSLTIEKDGQEEYVRISEEKGEGIVWLPVKKFKEGIIEVEMRGKDVFQRSFIGLAFHGQNDSTFDAVYCRPFNFYATDSVRRVHAVQYISHPAFTWKFLRENRNSLFEKEIKNAPQPNDWFVMTIEITSTIIRVFINNSNKAVLEVHKLSTYNEGKLGLFVGDNSGGDFKTVKLNEAKERIN
jgi:hypothetical protein